MMLALLLLPLILSTAFSAGPCIRATNLDALEDVVDALEDQHIRLRQIAEGMQSKRFLPTIVEIFRNGEAFEETFPPYHLRDPGERRGSHVFIDNNIGLFYLMGVNMTSDLKRERRHCLWFGGQLYLPDLVQLDHVRRMLRGATNTILLPIYKDNKDSDNPIVRNTETKQQVFFLSEYDGFDITTLATDKHTGALMTISPDISVETDKTAFGEKTGTTLCKLAATEADMNQARWGRQLQEKLEGIDTAALRASFRDLRNKTDPSSCTDLSIGIPPALQHIIDSIIEENESLEETEYVGSAELADSLLDLPQMLRGAIAATSIVIDYLIPTVNSRFVPLNEGRLENFVFRSTIFPSVNVQSCCTEPPTETVVFSNTIMY